MELVIMEGEVPFISVVAYIVSAEEHLCENLGYLGV